MGDPGPGSGQQFGSHGTVHIRQAEVPTLGPVGQSLVIDAHHVEHCCLEVVDTDWSLIHVGPPGIGRSDDGPGLVPPPAIQIVKQPGW